MVLLKSRYKAVYLLLALMVAGPATAEVPVLTPFNYKLKYDVTWNNLPIGRVRMTVTEDDYKYKMVVDTKTRGIVRMFDPTVSIITTNGRFKDDKAVPQRYESKSTDEDSTKTTTVTYNADGNIKTRIRKPADDPAARPVVPLSEADTGTDPLTGMYQLRRDLRDNMERNARDTVMRTYDGARLADFTFRVVSRARVKVDGKYYDAINTVMTRKPIAGYKAKELKKYREGDPTIHVYFSADERLLPLQADINLSFGAITATLTDIENAK